MFSALWSKSYKSESVSDPEFGGKKKIKPRGFPGFEIAVLVALAEHHVCTWINFSYGEIPYTVDQVFSVL